MRQSLASGNGSKGKQHFLSCGTRRHCAIAPRALMQKISIIVGDQQKEHIVHEEGALFSELTEEPFRRKFWRGAPYWFVELARGAGFGYQNSARVMKRKASAENVPPSSSINVGFFRTIQMALERISKDLGMLIFLPGRRLMWPPW